MNLRKIIYVVSIVFLLILGANHTRETYSRYASAFSGSGNAGAAKWAVVLKDNGTPLQNNFEVKFVSTGNENVAPDRLAPGTSGKAALAVDLTGTEVSVDYNVTVDTSALNHLIHSGAMQFNVTVDTPDGSGSVEPGKYTYVPLPLNENGSPGAFTADNGVLTFNFSLDWVGDNSQNDADTNLALNYAEALNLPVSVTIRQHIDSGSAEDSGQKVTSNIMARYGLPTTVCTMKHLGQIISENLR